MTISNSYFAWEIAYYLAYSMLLIILFGFWGYFSPNINTCIRSKTTIKLRDVFGQVFWRYFKCVSISVGILGLLGAFIGIEKNLDDLFRPDLQKYTTSEMGNYRSAVKNLLKGKCDLILSERSPCITVQTALDFMEQGTIDKKLGIDFINKKLESIADNQSIRQIRNISERMSPAFSILNEPSSVEPRAKLIYSIISVYALAFALAVSFGEAVFQFKMELIKDEKINEKHDRVRLSSWFFSMLKSKIRTTSKVR